MRVRSGGLRCITEQMQSYGSSQLCMQILARICFCGGCWFGFGLGFFPWLVFLGRMTWGWRTVLVGGIFLLWNLVLIGWGGFVFEILLGILSSEAKEQPSCPCISIMGIAVKVSVCSCHLLVKFACGLDTVCKATIPKFKVLLPCCQKQNRMFCPSFTLFS